MTIDWQRRDSLSTQERLDVLHLLNQVEVRIGREALDESRRRAIQHETTAQHWLGMSDGRIVDYAMLDGATPTVEMCGGHFDGQLCTKILDLTTVIDWWRRDVKETLPNVVRTLQFMTATIDERAVDVPAGYLVRAFRSHVDDLAWLEMNNAAFSSHPEQGRWNMADLHAREHEPWFDPSGFLLLHEGSTLVASCWTKVHELSARRFGEIYVLSVSPHAQGRGLGRLMVNLGLSSLLSRGVATASLYVDAANTQAVALYESLGFADERHDCLVRFGG